jgi:hypothetical protein
MRERVFAIVLSYSGAEIDRVIRRDRDVFGLARLPFRTDGTRLLAWSCTLNSIVTQAANLCVADVFCFAGGGPANTGPERTALSP